MYYVELNYKTKITGFRITRHEIMKIDSPKIAEALLEIFSQIKSGNLEIIDASIFASTKNDFRKEEDE